ncbi:hypothetical protein M0804_013631 [Polistes exclamans]|nr:hypothetical protein M0804_013631 [Polistes exclamans]
MMRKTVLWVIVGSFCRLEHVVGGISWLVGWLQHKHKQKLKQKPMLMLMLKLKPVVALQTTPSCGRYEATSRKYISWSLFRSYHNVENE